MMIYRLPYEGYDIVETVLPPDIETAYRHINSHWKNDSEDEKIRQYWLCMFGGNSKNLDESRLAFNAWYYNDRYRHLNQRCVIDCRYAYYSVLYGHEDW